jgi:hypothetical protein
MPHLLQVLHLKNSLVNIHTNLDHSIGAHGLSEKLTVYKKKLSLEIYKFQLSNVI